MLVNNDRGIMHRFDLAGLIKDVLEIEIDSGQRDALINDGWQQLILPSRQSDIARKPPFSLCISHIPPALIRPAELTIIEMV